MSGKIIVGFFAAIIIGIIVSNPNGSSSTANSIGSALVNETKALQLR